MYGSEKWICEPNPVRRWAYRLLGEINVPGRLRSYHILGALRRLGLMDRPIRMLEAGCGKGDLAIYLARRNPHWQIVGLELDPEKVERARLVAERLGLTNIEFRLGNLEDPSFDSEFDLILNADVLEHIQDDVTVIRNFCRALRPGGFVLVTSPSIPQRKHLRTVYWREKRIGFHPSDYGHVRDGYSKQDLEEKFAAAGGRVVDCRFTFGLFGTLAFDVFFSIGDSHPNPVVYALMFPWLMALAGLDLALPTRTGSAILAVAQRPAS
jgi:2-polyprenyl-3-methyl-5-hydroxy-6-metoxy-1,4-benzoquinol methylase